MSDEGPDEEPVVPEYRSPRDDAQWTETDRARAILGGILGTASVLGLVFLWIFCVFEAHESSSGPTAIMTAVVVTLCVVLAIGGIARYQWTTYRSRAFLLGTLAGVGIGLLIEGVCFASVMGR